MITAIKSLTIDGNRAPVTTTKGGYTFPPVTRHEKSGVFKWGSKKLKTAYERDLVGGTELDYFRRVEKKYEGRLPNANVLDFLMENPELIPFKPYGGDYFVFVGTEFGEGYYRAFNWYDGRVDLLQDTSFIANDSCGYLLEDPNQRPPFIVIFE